MRLSLAVNFRWLVLLLVLALFALAWLRLDVVEVKAVGQPSMTGPIQSRLEQPFFETLAQKHDLPFKVDYRTVDKLGFKDDYQLSMLKEGVYDLVSLRFLQNSQEEPSIMGLDLIGLGQDFSQARRIANAYRGVIDENLQKHFKAKLLGIWTFGPQVLFCNRPIGQLADIKGLKVRVGGASMAHFIQSLGGVPVVIPFDQVESALRLNVVHCAVSSQISAHSAQWPAHLTHVYPVPIQMGLNGIAIRLGLWQQLPDAQKGRLLLAVQGYEDEVWSYAECLDAEASNCNQGKEPCLSGPRYALKSVPVRRQDLDVLRTYAVTHAYRTWVEECRQKSRDCATPWQATVKPLLAAAGAR